MRKRKGKRKHGEFSKLDFTPCVLWAFFLSLSLSSLTLTHSQNFLCQHIRQQQSSLSLFLSSSSVCSTHTFLSLSHFGSVHNVDQSLCVSGSLKGESAAHAKPRFKTSSIPILVFFIWRNKKEVQKRADEEEKRIRKIETCLADWLTDWLFTNKIISFIISREKKPNDKDTTKVTTTTSTTTTTAAPERKRSGRLFSFPEVAKFDRKCRKAKWSKMRGRSRRRLKGGPSFRAVGWESGYGWSFTSGLLRWARRPIQ